MKRFNRLTTALATVLAATVALALMGSTATAQTDDADDARFEQMLLAIDVVPDRAALEAGWPDAAERLRDAATDPQRDTWTRTRALTLLSAFADDPRNRDVLLALAEDDDAYLRRHAIYTLGVAFAATGDAQALTRVVDALGDADQATREDAVRALARVSDPRAHEALRSLPADAVRPIVLERALQAR
jgi:HEAT repeat protein